MWQGKGWGADRQVDSFDEILRDYGRPEVDRRQILDLNKPRDTVAECAGILESSTR